MHGETVEASLDCDSQNTVIVAQLKESGCDLKERLLRLNSNLCFLTEITV